MTDTLTRRVDFRTSDNGDGLTLEGIAAVFNQETIIDSWEGHFRERIAPGAFSRTLVEDRAPLLQYDHGTHPSIGNIPLGRFDELSETDEGLYVRARLFDNFLVGPVRDAIAGGGLTGMSFRFTVNDDTVEKEKGQLPLRTINDVTLYELGPVAFPAYAGTSVGVRSHIRELVSDPEVLRGLAEVLLTSGDADPSAVSTQNGDVIDLARVRVRKTRLRLKGF